MKINLLITKPTEILRIALFPRAAKDKDLSMIRKSILVSFLTATLLVTVVNIFLPFIVRFFLNEDVDLLPIRLFTLAPILLSISVLIAFNVFVAFGYNRYVLNSILITTSSYVIMLVSCAFTHHLNTLMTFVMISILSYLVEFVYRVLKYKKIVCELAPQ